ncbi:unnamed protein product [Symbiodinium sp. CCMP2456]|nr:unnamed protein product [Symbiodinium sp. CCMP2456]
MDMNGAAWWQMLLQIREKQERMEYILASMQESQQQTAAMLTHMCRWSPAQQQRTVEMPKLWSSSFKHFAKAVALLCFDEDCTVVWQRSWRVARERALTDTQLPELGTDRDKQFEHVAAMASRAFRRTLVKGRWDQLGNDRVVPALDLLASALANALAEVEQSYPQSADDLLQQAQRELGAASEVTCKRQLLEKIQSLLETQGLLQGCGNCGLPTRRVRQLLDFLPLAPLKVCQFQDGDGLTSSDYPADLMAFLQDSALPWKARAEVHLADLLCRVFVNSSDGPVERDAMKVECAIFAPLGDKPPEYLIRRLKLGLLSPLFAPNQLFAVSLSQVFAVSDKTDVRRTRFSRDRAVADFVCENTPMELRLAVFNLYGAIKKEPELVDFSGIQSVNEITNLDSETRRRIWDSMNVKITSPERHLVQLFSEAIQTFTKLPQSSAKPKVEEEENIKTKDASEYEAEGEANATSSDEDTAGSLCSASGDLVDTKAHHEPAGCRHSGRGFGCEHHMQMAWAP